ncbi:hypothetical protein IWW34DRAFT_809026 [Fusarium oxysporum f. sp. albedinis]|nr:hypothetical protein IWW34DRAFT_809026 [Fusarium oxysporum f. sp. albedinis]
MPGIPEKTATSFPTRKGFEGFIGTGWLVNEDIVVTAGHSLYDWTYMAHSGVVRYPGDLDFGEHLYEHWATVDIDLARTGTLLSYRIDTSGGQNGAPVLRKRDDCRLEAVGVHVGGGYPNVGSVIGPYGNSFEEFILALDGTDDVIKSPTVTIAQTKGLAPGFQLLSFQPQSTHTNPSDSTADVLGGDKGCFDETSGLDRLLGNSIPRGSLTTWPENLKLTEAGDPLPPVDFDKAFKNAKDQDDVRTTFLINFTEPLEGKALEVQRKLMSSIKTWQAWATINCEAKVQQQVDAGALPSDSKGQNARSTYRAKVFDFLFNRSTCREQQQYWVMFTRSEYEEITQTVQAVTQDAKHYASRKGSYDEVSFNFNFHQYQAEFVEAIVDGVKDKMDKRQIEQGEELLEDRITDVVVPTK